MGESFLWSRVAGLQEVAEGSRQEVGAAPPEWSQNIGKRDVRGVYGYAEEE